MSIDEACEAKRVFGSLQLEDPRLRRRAYDIAAGCCRHAGGTVTGTFTDSADREATYRFLSNPRVPSGELIDALVRSSAVAAASYPFVYVPIDGSSLQLTDRKKVRETGIVGTRKAGARGLTVTTSMAVAPSGVPLGSLGFEYWARDVDVSPKAGELAYATALMHRVVDVLETHAPATRPWFQLDRGYDARLVLEALESLTERGVLWTVRAVHDRRLQTPSNSPREYAQPSLLRQRPMGTMTVHLRKAGVARKATLTVRALATVLSGERPSGTRWSVPVTYVDAREGGKSGLRWTLLTNESVTSFEDAIRVLHGYTTRWRIEEFHRAWKTGACDVEATQLRSREGIVKWATFLAMAASRAARIAYLARETPDIPATQEFPLAELKAAVLLTKQPASLLKARLASIDRMNLREAVDLIANLGGYTGLKSSGGPPGPTVLARGLARVIDASSLLDSLETSRE